MKSMRILLALAIATPLAAQRPDSAKPAMPGMVHRGMPSAMAGHDTMGPMMQHMQGMQGMMGPMMEPMLRSMAFTPDHLLARKDALELTAQQVTRLTVLRDAAKTAHDAAQSDMHTHMQAMAQAMKATAPDTNALKQHFQAAQAAMGRAHWSMLSAAAQARALLTDAQRGRVEGWADMMQQHMGQMMMRQHQNPPEH